MTESVLLKQILLAIGAHPDLRVWRNNTGQAWTGNQVFTARKTGPVILSPGDVVIRQAHPIRFGLEGSPDLIGIRRGGQFVGIEVKTPSGRVSERQQAFGNMVQGMGGIWMVARSVEDARQGIL